LSIQGYPQLCCAFATRVVLVKEHIDAAAQRTHEPDLLVCDVLAHRGDDVFVAVLHKPHRCLKPLHDDEVVALLEHVLPP
jgi:hypothetical protein